MYKRELRFHTFRIKSFYPPLFWHEENTSSKNLHVHWHRFVTMYYNTSGGNEVNIFFYYELWLRIWSFLESICWDRDLWNNGITKNSNTGIHIHMFWKIVDIYTCSNHSRVVRMLFTYFIFSFTSYDNTMSMNIMFFMEKFDCQDLEKFDFSWSKHMYFA